MASSNPKNRSNSGDPIDYLRRQNYDHLRRTDSDDEGGLVRAESLSFRPKRASSGPEEPPARERPSNGEQWPYRENLSFTRNLIFYGAGSITNEHKLACEYIQEARSLRKMYHGGNGTKVSSEDVLKTGDLRFAMPEGVAELYHAENGSENLVTVPTIEEFERDYKRHATMNSSVEQQEQSNLLGTDFYRTMKIDNHIHAAAAPSAKQFVLFVKNKLEQEADQVVGVDRVDGIDVPKTLSQVYEENGLDMNHLTIDAFNVLADYSVYQRFDNFNDKYSPFRLADMRRIFLKTSNHMKGRYFAELLKHVISRHEQNKGHNSACEMRLSIYGMERHEWYDLAVWMLTEWDHPDLPGNMISTQNKWLIQIPRLWRIYSKKPTVNDEKRSFQEMLENLFVPMFEATLYPDKHPEIAEALQHIVGLDSVDDEGALEEPLSSQRPSDWTTSKNPSYAWQLYYIWANLQVLNRLRSARGLNTLSFRPHAGETGDPMHLAATYILCHSINHGVVLDAQIADSPFPKFFRRGLNVTLSTDDPLLFHLSDDALLEEYSVARATFDLSMVDMMEIARNSVKQSGFDEDFKQQWLGKEYRRGLTFCDEKLTHVPLIRAKFRAEHLALEHMMVHLIAAGKGDTVLQEMKVQFGLARDAHRDVLFENFEEVPAFPERNQL